MKVLVAEPLGDEGLQMLRAAHDVDYTTGLSRADFLSALPVFDGLIVRSQIRVDAEALSAAGRLKVVGRAGVGLDNIDVEAAHAAGIAVVNAPDSTTAAVAEHTLGLMFALARRIAVGDASVRRGEWRRAELAGIELAGRTLGVIGLGRIGLAVARRGAALGMQVVGNDPFVPGEVAAAQGIRAVSMTELLGSADVVTVHIPLTTATRGLIDGAAIAGMKRGALLINVARGGIVDEQALAEALREGHLAGAAVDVFEREPPLDSPLLDAPNTVLTPHLGASTVEAQGRVSVEVAQRVLEALAAA